MIIMDSLLMNDTSAVELTPGCGLEWRLPNVRSFILEFEEADFAIGDNWAE